MKEELQRKTAGTTAPPVAHEGLRAPVRPLEAEPRPPVGEGFGHDFGRVAVLQRQPLVDKPSETEEKKKKKKDGPEAKLTEDSGFTVTSKEGKPVEIKNKFKVGASLKVPLTSDLKLGAVAFLQSLEVKAEGSNEGPEPIPAGGTDLSTLQTSLALDLVRLKLARIRPPKFSFEGGLSSKGSLTGSFGPDPGATGEIGAEASLKLGYASGSLFPSSLGSLTFASDLTGTAGVTQPLGKKPEKTPSPTTPPAPDEGAKPSASFEATGKVAYESPKLPIRGSNVRIIGDVNSLFSVKADPDKTTTKGGVGGGLGLKIQTTKKIEISIKAKATYERAVEKTMEPAKKTPSQAFGGNAVIEVKF